MHVAKALVPQDAELILRDTTEDTLFVWVHVGWRVAVVGIGSGINHSVIRRRCRIRVRAAAPTDGWTGGIKGRDTKSVQVQILNGNVKLRAKSLEEEHLLSKRH
jgi:hypothetical protein